MKYYIETSHMVAIPPSYTAGSLEELQSQVQATADGKRVGKGHPAIGELSFTWDEEAKKLHAFFTDRHGKRRRFMRLRQEQSS